ncbi:hypothetical protein BN2475_690056 [Paraburkholderia ribeironis]|uniref:Uncharacterized protein n=1 Tax=Paraburkholderia ribeironis TaxID=1247936 RepID=A0A1N7SHC5_9BURK|nr:hypothetical protein BN2475_690056 [Paraburkholderia ribeironis]
MTSLPDGQGRVIQAAGLSAALRGLALGLEGHVWRKARSALDVRALFSSETLTVFAGT